MNGSRLKQQTSHYKRKQTKYNYVSKDCEKPRQQLFCVFRHPAHGRQRGLVYQVIPNLNAVYESEKAFKFKSRLRQQVFPFSPHCQVKMNLYFLIS